MARKGIADEQRLLVEDGQLVAPGSWVYVWAKGNDVLYVGATGLPPAIRTWLHLHDDSPEVGRVRAEHPEALRGCVTVRAFELAEGLDRQRVRQCLLAELGQATEEVGTDEERVAALDILERLSST